MEVKQSGSPQTTLERRSRRFIERLSIFMSIVAAFGAFVVLLDVKIAVKMGDGSIISFGGTFSSDLKGAVISAILIGGWSAVKEYWLGSSANAQGSTESMNRIAEHTVTGKVNGEEKDKH